MNIKTYFTDLYLFQNPTFGSSSTHRRYLWLTACYLGFIFGIFSRQVTQFPTIDLNLKNLSVSVFISSVIIGVGLFPFIIRQVAKLVRNFTVVREWDEKSVEALNPIHVMCSISWGFFIDIIISKLDQLVGVFF